MSSDPIEVLREKVRRWRKEESRHEEGMNSVGPAVSNYHEGMSQAFGECADELDTALTSLSAPKPEGEVVVTRDEAGTIVAVTRQDAEGRTLSVIAEAAPKPESAEAVIPWVREWKGSGPQRGFHIREATRLHNNRVVAYLGDQVDGDEVDKLIAEHNGKHPNGDPVHTAPPRPEASAPVGVEAVDAAAWIKALELPEGYRVAEHLPGIWEYQFDIEDEADDDSDRKVSGASWNHPALAAIAAWSHAYEALAQQPAAVDGARDLIGALQVAELALRERGLQASGEYRQIEATLAKYAGQQQGGTQE